MITALKGLPQNTYLRAETSIGWVEIAIEDADKEKNATLTGNVGGVALTPLSKAIPKSIAGLPRLVPLLQKGFTRLSENTSDNSENIRLKLRSKVDGQEYEIPEFTIPISAAASTQLQTLVQAIDQLRKQIKR